VQAGGGGEAEGGWAVIRGAGAGGWGEGRGGVLVEMPGGGDVGAVGMCVGFLVGWFGM